MALTFCGKKSEVGASVSYGHISSLTLFDLLEIWLNSCLSVKQLGAGSDAKLLGI